MDGGVHQRDVDGWRYNPGDNTIALDGTRFHPLARIEVSDALWKGPLEEQEEAAE